MDNTDYCTISMYPKILSNLLGILFAEQRKSHPPSSQTHFGTATEEKGNLCTMDSRYFVAVLNNRFSYNNKKKGANENHP